VVGSLYFHRSVLKMKKNSSILISAALIILSATPFNLWYLSFFCLVPVLFISRTLNKSETIKILFTFGCIIGVGGWYGVAGTKWYYFLYPLIVMSVAFGLWAYLYFSLNKLINKNYLLRLLVLSIVWVGIERILASEYIGIPGHLAMGLASQPLLIQFSSVLGIYGVSLLVIFSNLAIAELVYEAVNYKNNIVWKKISIIGSSLLIVGLLNVIFGLYNNQPVIEDDANKISVASIQPMISYDIYYNLWRNQEDRIFTKKIMEELTSKAAEMDVDVVVWPEGGNGFLNMRVSKLRDYWYAMAESKGVDLLISTNDIDEKGNKYNSIFSISNQGELLGRYDKNILVPFEESHYTSGDKVSLLSMSKGLVGSVICYESIFPELARELTALGAQFLYVSTSDVSFLNSNIPLGHAQLSIFRAVENSRWVVHASNAGPSLFISPTGEVKQSSDFYSREIVKGDIYLRNNITFYTAYGYLIIYLFSFFSFLLLVYFLFEDVRGFKKKRRSKVAKSSALTRELTDDDVVYQLKKFGNGVLKVCLNLTPVFVFVVSIVVFSIYRVSTLYKDDITVVDSVNAFAGSKESLHKNTSDILFKQAQKNTCGPATLAYLLSYYGFETTEDEVLKHVNLTHDGTTMLDMKNAVEHYGFSATGYKENYAALQKEALPVIAYINNSHYVVMLKVMPDKVVLFDPAIGNIAVSKPGFISIWNGYLLSLKMKPIMNSPLVEVDENEMPQSM
jgi:apolipoprotein N-acyltransferase